MLKRKDLLGLKDITAEEMEEILSTAVQMRKILDQNVKKTPHLQGKSVTTLFYENSTRTRTSFETAAKIMGANTTSISAQTSSVTKGETLIDTGKNLDALLTDVIIMRHSMSGAPHLLAKNVKASVINAGDGMNEHPTQALLDIYTMKEKFGDIKGLKVVIAGDVKHSRVARSNIWGLRKLGAEVTVCAPKTLLPAGIEETDVSVSTDLDDCIAGANVVMGLRLQLERQQAGLFPSAAEYNAYYGLNAARLDKADGDAILMHPGPVNRGLEIGSDIADCEQSYILRQVTNGVAVRMAVLFLLTRAKQQ
ncbi:aspartate carbamoyltransferase catalytic subunit [Pumilibacter intestinalis]|uniref:aspartate carbamoyltransferase catalytic subunit n=1 Tax=Pumilibacter intestinalis TaxID=2941511 RepID=UPI00203CFA7C|nr:aspartate carbamoyltransferase catalytic subunit [Pumilibacter intestinalis]MCI8487733.1 aspartate carbamoyltransferase catalytic subunit [Clostridia bacterium]